MDANKSRKRSLTTFPILKARKKQSFTSIKVSIIESQVRSSDISRKMWRSLLDPGRLSHPSLEDSTGVKLWETQMIGEASADFTCCYDKILELGNLREKERVCLGSQSEGAVQCTMMGKA